MTITRITLQQLIKIGEVKSAEELKRKLLKVISREGRMMNDEQSIAHRGDGPGRGWHGPPKGTHGPGSQGGKLGQAKITKAYKYGVDSKGEIWASGAMLQKRYDKYAKLYQRHSRPGGSSEWKKFAEERLKVLEKYQHTGRRQLTSEEQQLLHRIARDSLPKGRVGG